jgi:nucleoside-diphosphate-sugar epimerase
MIKVAVTGATGFIGRYVLAELNNLAVEVVAVARGQRDDLQKIRNVRWIQMDIKYPPAKTFEKLGRPEVLIHLAWQGLPNYSSLHHFEVELPIHYAFLKQLIEQGLNSVLVAGTCFEYGLQSGPLSEDMETRSTNPYGFAKDTLRKQLQFLHAVHPFNLTWARLFYMYGDGQHDSSLISQLKKAAERGDKAFNMSGGEQLRDYLPVTNVAASLVALALNRTNAGIVNICSGKPISVRNLIECLIKKNNWSIKLNLGHYSYPDYEPMAFWGDIDKLKTIMKEN